MKTKYASIIAIVDGVEREVVDQRQPCDGFAEVEGDAILLHLRGDPVGPITAIGDDMRLAIFAEPAGGEWLATLLLVPAIGVGDYVPLC